MSSIGMPIPHRGYSRDSDDTSRPQRHARCHQRYVLPHAVQEEEDAEKRAWQRVGVWGDDEEGGDDGGVDDGGLRG